MGAALHYYYKRIFSQAILNYATLCDAAGDYKSIIKYCEKAIAMDPYEESNHIALIKALIDSGQLSQALAHYNYIASVLRKDLGVEPSDTLQSLNKHIRNQLEDVQYDIASIQNDLSEKNFEGGAYYCDIDVFREIFRLEKRALERSGLSAYLALVSLVGQNDKPPAAADLSIGLALLKKIALFGLRRGDVVTQYSKSQLLLLLPSNSFETCEKILARLEKNFIKARGHLDVKLTKNIQHIKK
jgi:tetratricopeptide (TPR) repeat protein